MEQFVAPPHQYEQKSVYFLIVELCESFARQNEGQGGAKLTAGALKRLKAQAHEILLKKSKAPSIEQFYDKFDAERAFAHHIFAAKLGATRCDCDPEQHERTTELEKKLDELFKSTYFTKGNGSLFLQLLLALQSNVPADGDEMRLKNIHEPELLVPAPFTIHGNYVNSRHYSMNLASQSVIQSKPRYFKGLTQMKCAENPYLPKSIFDGEPNRLFEIERKYELCKPKKENTEKGLQNIQVAPFQLFTDLGFRIPVKKLEAKSKNVTASKVNEGQPKPKQLTVKEKPRIFSWNWENLACPSIACAQPFASETSISFDILGHHYKTIGRSLQAKLVKDQEFIQDLKALTVGIQSDSFWHDEYIIFHMHENLTVKGLLPATMNDFISDFLECGTCFKRLQMMIMKKEYKLMFEGFIFKALCSAVDEYLLTFRQFVFAREDTNLIDFHKRLQSSIRQITNLSLTLAIHPDVDASIKPPMGSQFLGYLYREIMRLTEPEYLTLLIFILKRCCHVYFKHLQKWIYYGVLDDSSNELFICFLDHYRQNTKYFYEKAYFVRKESVPGFFQGYEDQILQCGKYTMLLKAFKPNHPLFDIDYPTMSVCLSFKEIDKLEATCKKYCKWSRERCGKPITIREIFEVRAQQRRNFCQIASQRSKAYMEKWLAEQHTLALIIAEQKKKRLEQLSVQLQDEKQRKIAERRANVEFELKLLREAEKLDDRLLVASNINLRKRIEYYQELSNLMKEDANVERRGSSKVPTISLTNAEDIEISPHLNTPSSIMGTDFESCEEDATSEYTECMSDEFVQQFADTEVELNTLYNREAKKEVNENNNEDSGFAKVLKRSVSDVLNSNELATMTTTMAQENRQQAMSGNEMARCVQQNTAISLKHAHAMTTKGVPEVEVLSEAKRNKLKVMSEEFGLYNPNCQVIVPDINLNTLPDDELSDAQRNRKRMMQNNPFSELYKDPFSDRSQLHLELDTERARNRRKVLESEFNILTGTKTISTTTFDVVTTPMSTTSDPPLYDALTDSEKANDVNNAVNKCSPRLKLEISQPPQEAEVATAHVSNQTPESALNTTGIMAKQGFEFTTTNKVHESDEVPIQNDRLSDAGNNYISLQQDYSEPYNRCLELINSNFQCPTRSPYVQLQKLPLRKSDKKASAVGNYKRFVPLDMNSMNAITLTEFLQQSVIKPMDVHLKILNSEVMRMFIDDLRVLDHFRSLRHYFFLMNGEFGAKICDGILEQLDGEEATPQKLLNYQMLHSILDTALGSSIIGYDKHTEQLSFIVKDIPEHFDLGSPSVLQTLSLSYRVDWPLNIILSPEVLEQYSNIFRYLIKVRRISWLLEHAYQLLKEAAKTYGKGLLHSPQYRHVQLIRHKFYHFVRSLQNHITSNALQASWKTFKDDLLHANSIKDICKKHLTYLKKILFLCMLNRRSVEFHNTIENIFKITLHFYNNLKSSEFKKQTVEGSIPHYIHSRYDAMAEDEIEFDKLIKYTIYLAEKIVRHGYQAEIGEFINLINYNQFYMLTF